MIEFFRDLLFSKEHSFDKRVFVLGIDFGDPPDHYADAAPGAYFSGIWVNRAKNAAFANACRAANCDTIVGARYDVRFKGCFLWQEIEVKVVGYPAKLTGVEFRKAKLD